MVFWKGLRINILCIHTSKPHLVIDVCVCVSLSLTHTGPGCPGHYASLHHGEKGLGEGYQRGQAPWHFSEDPRTPQAQSPKDEEDLSPGQHCNRPLASE